MSCYQALDYWINWLVAVTLILAVSLLANAVLATFLVRRRRHAPERPRGPTMQTQALQQKLRIAQETDELLRHQFERFAQTVRQIAALEAALRKEGDALSPALKLVVEQQIAAAYQRLQAIREWTDDVVSEYLASVDTAASAPAGWGRTAANRDSFFARFRENLRGVR